MYKASLSSGMAVTSLIFAEIFSCLSAMPKSVAKAVAI